MTCLRASSGGGTGCETCSSASSSVNSGGSRSDRVENSWPILMKVGPSSRMAPLSHTAVARRRRDCAASENPPGYLPADPPRQQLLKSAVDAL